MARCTCMDMGAKTRRHLGRVRVLPFSSLTSLTVYCYENHVRAMSEGEYEVGEPPRYLFPLNERECERKYQ